MQTKFIAAAAFAALASPFLLGQPAHAGAWQLTSSMTGGFAAGDTDSGPTVNSTSSSYSFSEYEGRSTISYTQSNFTYTGKIQWIPNGSLASDPAPATVTLSETGDVYGDTLYGTGTTSASDGLGDPGVTTTTNGYPGPSQTTTSSGSHTTVISISAGGSYTFSRHITSYANGGGYNGSLVQYQNSVK